MSYHYHDHKSWVFTEEGQVTFLRIRDHVTRLLKLAGAVRLNEALTGTGGGDSWQLMACVDRLVELGELKELPTNGPAQDRVFVRSRARENP